MIEITIDETTDRQGLALRSFRLHDVNAVHKLIAKNRVRLDQWLRWSARLQTLEDVDSFVSRFEQKEVDDTGFHLGIWQGEDLAGGAVCWNINHENKNTEIGYWLGAQFTGRGLATQASLAVIDYLFEQKGLNRVEMQCGVQNKASRRVAERCGLVLEGVLRESHWISNRFVDHAVYGLLRHDWAG